MELILWRHADAEDGTPDAERKLTAKGVKQAERMAKWLRARIPPDAIILASPAIRAQQTARALSANIKTVNEIGAAATPEGIMRAAGWPRNNHAVVVVGHQPTLGETAARLITGKSEQWSLKKGAVVWVACRPDAARAHLRALISVDLL